MNNEHESHAAVVAEMRNRTDLNGGDMVDNFSLDASFGEYGGYDPLPLIKAYAERAEAAHKREVDALTAMRRVYLVVETSHETGGEPDTRIAHVCATRLRAQELLEQDGAFITNLPDSSVNPNRIKGRNDEWEYDYYITEMEVEA